MKVRVMFLVLFVILDVVSPASCGGRKKNDPVALFCYEIRDEETNYSAVEHTKLATKNEIIDFIVPSNFPEGYKIVGWQRFAGYNENDPQYFDVSFPYTTSEGDFLAYHIGYRNCVVFRAIIEKMESE